MSTLNPSRGLVPGTKAAGRRGRFETSYDVNRFNPVLKNKEGAGDGGMGWG